MVGGKYGGRLEQLDQRHSTAGVQPVSSPGIGELLPFEPQLTLLIQLHCQFINAMLLLLRLYVILSFASNTMTPLPPTYSRRLGSMDPKFQNNMTVSVSPGLCYRKSLTLLWMCVDCAPKKETH